jgi:serine/threonine protein kinase
MTQPNFNFETLDVPQPIRTKLVELSGSIEFTKRSRKGSSGWLFFGRNRIHNQRVAVKFYDWGGDPRYHAEPANLAAISSNHVIQILDASFVDPDYAYFLTPYYEEGDLDEEICGGIQGNLRAISVTRDILSGLSHLHSGSFLHRDLKPQNILISNDSKAVIGDFGSVKKIPAGCSTVPGSGHSLIYRPPESVLSGHYGVPGDIYQVGMVLFQLLGGQLPYEESAWLNSRELAKYHEIEDSIDRQIFSNNCVKNKIRQGRIVKISTLPPWVCRPLRRTVSKACNVDPHRRYQSCSEFLARLNSIRDQIHDWRLEEGFPVRHGKPKYRIVFQHRKNIHFVQKNSGSGWRRDNSFRGYEVSDLVDEIENKAR